MIPSSSGNEVVFIDNDGLGTVVFMGGEQPVKIGGYAIELHYSSSNIIESVNEHPIFYIVDYINNSAGVTVIEGFALTNYDLSSNIELVSFNYTGGNQFDIIVRELFNWEVQPIECKNYEPYPSLLPEEDELPEYVITPEYVSPGSNGTSENTILVTQRIESDQSKKLQPIQKNEPNGTMNTTEDLQEVRYKFQEENSLIDDHSIISENLNDQNLVPAEASLFPVGIIFISIGVGGFLYLKKKR